MSMDRREVEEIVRLAVKATVPECVRHTLEHYGFDAARPLEVQRDQLFLRSARTFFNSMVTRVLSIVVLTMLAAAAAWAFGAGKLGG